ncbi:MAG: iron(III) transport system permease protein, partial [Verrucomicrobiales bacterium]
MSRNLAYTIFAMTALFFAVFFVLPIFHTLKGAFVSDGSFTLSYVLHIFGNPLYMEGLMNALLIGVWSTFLCMVIALPLALVANRFLFPGKTILSSLILIPLILPPFVGAIGIKQILGQQGALNAFLSKLGLMDMEAPHDWLGENRFWGIILMNALHLYPIIYLNITAALANLDPAMEEAAQDLGCTAVRRFWRITFPLMMPGVFAGATIVFIWSFTELGVPLIFDFHRVTSVQIFDGLKELSGNPLPYALVAVMLLVSVVLYSISKFFFGRNTFTTSGRASMASQPKTLPRWQAIGCTAMFVIITGLAVVPHFGVIFMSVAGDWYQTVFPSDLTLQHYSDALGHELTVPSIANSLKYASLSTLIDIILGVAIAYVVVRTKIPGRGALDAIAMLPLAVPGLVLAFGYLALSSEGEIFHALVPNGNPIFILVLAYAIRRLPYVVRSAVAGFQQTSPTLEEAAQNLGASPPRAL